MTFLWDSAALTRRSRSTPVAAVGEPTDARFLRCSTFGDPWGESIAGVREPAGINAFSSLTCRRPVIESPSASTPRGAAGRRSGRAKTNEISAHICLCEKGWNGMFIDCHVHVTLTQAVRRNSNGQTYATPPEMVQVMDSFGIDKAVLLAGVSPECRHRFVTPEDVLACTAQYPDRFIPFCNLDPRMDTNSPKADFSKFLEYYKQAGCRGVGEFVPNLPFDDPMVENLMRQVEAADLPLTIHIAPKVGGYYGLYDDLGLPRLESALKKFPKLKVLGHSQPFWAEMSGDLTEQQRNTYPKGRVAPGGRVPELFAKYPNLYGDLSAGSGFNAISRDPEFGDKFLEDYQDRLLFGTDLTAVDQKPEQPAYFREILEKGRISREAFEKITWKNANRILRLGIKE